MKLGFLCIVLWSKLFFLLEQLLFRLAQKTALAFCFYAFFCAKPVSTFAENALTMSAVAAAGNICEAEMVSAAERHHVPLGVLYAVGLTETGRRDSLQPYALNIGGKAVFAQSQQEALRHFHAARKRGITLIDLGCMQINHYYHGQNFASPQEMLQPATNVTYAAKFLSELYQREGSWTLAVARYHAGPNNNPAQKRYVCRVLHNMVASGFGNWTAKARAFCSSKKS